MGVGVETMGARCALDAQVVWAKSVLRGSFGGTDGIEDISEGIVGLKRKRVCWFRLLPDHPPEPSM